VRCRAVPCGAVRPSEKPHGRTTRHPTDDGRPDRASGGRGSAGGRASSCTGRAASPSPRGGASMAGRAGRAQTPRRRGAGAEEGTVCECAAWCGIRGPSCGWAAAQRGFRGSCPASPAGSGTPKILDGAGEERAARHTMGHGLGPHRTYFAFGGGGSRLAPGRCHGVCVVRIPDRRGLRREREGRDGKTVAKGTAWKLPLPTAESPRQGLSTPPHCRSALLRARAERSTHAHQA